MSYYHPFDELEEFDFPDMKSKPKSKPKSKHYNPRIARIIGDRELKNLKKFYVGSRNPQDSGWAKNTLQEAITHAKQLVKETGDDQYVVQIIRVIRVKHFPIVVEKV